MIRRTLLLAALLACAPAPAEAPPADRSAGFLRVVTWNVHNFFDEVDERSPPGDADLVPPHAEVEAKLARIGAVLLPLRADVIVLQEVENRALLERLAAGPLAALGYTAFLRDGYDPRGIDVGFLSRIRFDPGPTHLDERGADGRRLWSRDVVEVHLTLAGREIAILGAHLVSLLDPGDDDRRWRQAARLRALIDALDRAPGAPLVLLVGDLNDVPDSAALAPLLSDGSLVDVGAAAQPLLAWTWSGLGARERIDYALLPGVERATVIRSDVLGGPEVDAASDHRPLVVDLWIPAAG